MDPNNTHEVIFWDNLYKLRPWLYKFCQTFTKYIYTVTIYTVYTLSLPLNVLIGQMIFHKSWRGVMLIVGVVLI